ncbi:MAG: sigma-70 family RNA polymerase sigma factor [Anaerolineales bacterium]|nr:sigma-70 family RNA polymerase sigma factor [Anaerolineales bacterium]
MADARRELAEMYDTHAPRIFRYIYHRLGNRVVAEDLTSEVFVRFLRARVAPDNLAAFLFRMAHNLIVDYLRGQRATQLLDETLIAEQSDPANLAEEEMRRARLRRALARLTAEQQQVIVLKFLEGFSNEEIARVLDKSVGAIKLLQHRGLATLRDLFSGEGDNVSRF